MNDKQTSEVVVIGNDIADLFKRMAKSMEYMEVKPEDVKSVHIDLYSPEPDKRLLVVEFNNGHDPNDCMGCDWERDHPEFKNSLHSRTIYDYDQGNK